MGQLKLVTPFECEPAGSYQCGNKFLTRLKHTSFALWGYHYVVHVSTLGKQKRHQLTVYSCVVTRGCWSQNIARATDNKNEILYYSIKLIMTSLYSNN